MDLKEGAEGRILGGREGNVGRIVINNPARHNAIGLDMWQAASDFADELAADPEVRLLVVSGAGGKAFAAGADISKFGSERSSADEVTRYQEISEGFYHRLVAFPKPTLAKINGYCIGGGLALALCCDMRICEEGARFGLPAARLSLGYSPAAQKQLVDLVGSSMAAEMMFTARQFSAAEAYDMGLVNRVVPGPDLDAYVEDYAATISQNAPLTIALAKACKIALETGTVEEKSAELQEMVAACYASDDYKEGQKAFLEKRRPNFRGR